MQAIPLTLYRYVLAALMAALVAAGLTAPAATQAQAQFPQGNTIASDLLAEQLPQAGGTLMVALRFTPQDGWHGYWANPGDAGQGMTLDWQLPGGWTAGKPLYPVPERLELIGLINHIYKREYAVLVPLQVPAHAASGVPVPISVAAQWLSCSDSLCVSESAELDLRYGAAGRPRSGGCDAGRRTVPGGRWRRRSARHRGPRVRR